MDKEIHFKPQQDDRVATPEVDEVRNGIEDGSDITKRRLMNDYSSYKPISTEQGKEQIRLLQILPPKGDSEDEELVCALFDVTPHMIPHGDRIVYIALSYCWGDMNQQRSISLIHHSLNDAEDEHVQTTDDGATQFAVNTDSKRPFSVTESLYQALKSLRKSATQLKEQFPILDHQPLWIDALCINQSDINERNSQVGMMRSIYSRAMFVFIWMGEDQEVMRGLHMIMGINRTLHGHFGDDFDILKPKDEHLKALLFNIHYKFEDEDLGPEGCLQVLQRFFNNRYFKRIWVLQEASCNAERTFIHVTNAQVPWGYILVAQRFCQLRQSQYFANPEGILPEIWGNLLRERLIHVREVRASKDSSHSPESCNVLAKLYNLFEHTYVDFEATDLRDKLYALLDFAQETQRGMRSRHELAPDYNKAVSQVFSDFTLWCIRYSGGLDALGLLSSGPRRVLSKDILKFGGQGSPPKSCLDVKSHPSWAIWPTSGGSWTQGRLLKLSQGPVFDLASKENVSLFNLATHPIIKVPYHLTSHFLSLGGKRMGTVKSVMRLPLKCFQGSKDESSFLKQAWVTDEIQEEMEKYSKWHHLTLTHPYRDMALKCDINTLWDMIKKGRLPAIFLSDETAAVVEDQEWLGRDGGRYQGKEELMFRDFLETLLLDPVYRGTSSLEPPEHSVPKGPWNDETIATSFALFWAQNDPHFSQVPIRIGEMLKAEMFARNIPQPKWFPLLCPSVGKCFFITEDERMGMCPPDSQSGDIIIALFGSRIPFVARPLRKEPELEDNKWDFDGCDVLKDQLYRIIGECYVHESMTSSFWKENESKLGPMEVFNFH